MVMPKVTVKHENSTGLNRTKFLKINWSWTKFQKSFAKLLSKKHLHDFFPRKYENLI